MPLTDENTRRERYSNDLHSNAIHGSNVSPPNTTLCTVTRKCGIRFSLLLHVRKSFRLCTKNDPGHTIILYWPKVQHSWREKNASV